MYRPPAAFSMRLLTNAPSKRQRGASICISAMRWSPRMSRRPGMKRTCCRQLLMTRVPTRLLARRRHVASFTSTRHSARKRGRFLSHAADACIAGWVDR